MLPDILNDTFDEIFGQRCHLNYDKHYHYATRRARRAVGDLFEDENA